MEKLIVFGTGNATVTKCYNTCFALKKENEYFLVDAGGGNQILSILENKQITLNQIHHIFVTHAHTDHVLGIIWVIRMIGQKINQGKYEGKLYLYAHKELIEKIKTICNLTLPKKITNLFEQSIIFVEVKDHEQKEILGEDFTFFDIHSTKEKQFGFSLAYNNKKLTCLGDEPYSENAQKYVENASYLLCEAFCLYEDREKFKPYEKHHSTVKDAAEIAEKFHVKNVVLWHTEDSDMQHRKEKYTKEAKQYYHGNIYVPNDLEEIEI